MSKMGSGGVCEDCVVCDFRSIGIFGALEDNLLDTANKRKTIHTYKARDVVFYSGTPPLAVYCIRTGRVKIYRAGSKGDEIVLRIYGPGDVFGQCSLFAGDVYRSTAEAIEPTEICVHPKDLIMELLANSSSLAIEFLARLAGDLRITQDLLLDVSQRSVKERTASLLLMFLDHCGEKTDLGMRLCIPIQRKEMAQMVGTTPETFSRTLHDLAEAGLLSLSRSEIVIVDTEALGKISTG